MVSIIRLCSAWTWVLNGMGGWICKTCRDCCCEQFNTDSITWNGCGQKLLLFKRSAILCDFGGRGGVRDTKMQTLFAVHKCVTKRAPLKRKQEVSQGNPIEPPFRPYSNRNFAYGRCVFSMAEALAVLGGVASAVQLADVICRISTELYSFFWAIRDASEEMQRLRDVLQGLESATRNIQLHNVEYASSIAAVEEHEVLPEVMTNLKNIKTELDALRTTTGSSVAAGHAGAGRQTSKLSQRMKWIYNKKHINAVVGRLEGHKSNLELAMIALGLYVQQCSYSYNQNITEVWQISD